MHADIDEHAEVDDIAHRAGELHAGLEVAKLQDIRAQNGLGQIVTDISAGL